MQAFRSKVFRCQWVFLALAITVTMFAGCESRKKRLTAAKLDDPGTAYAENRDHLILALDFLDSFHEYDTGEIVPRITNHLQTWISDVRPVDDWLADPLFGRLPRRLNVANQPITLSRLQFQPADLTMLREAMWLSEIAQAVTARDVRDEEVSAWLAEQESELGIDGVRDLASAFQLFDWVIRNVQIEEGPETIDGIPFSSRFSWEALLLGRGDASLRAELFILLCRQARVPAFVLGIEADPVNRPWVVGAWVADRLFLFDPKLGLPLPGEGGRGVVDLQTLLDQPELLQKLDTTEQPYEFEEADLGRLVAMFDGTPGYLSQRMRAIEDALPAEKRMVLTATPSALAREIRAAFPNLVGVELWTLPYDTVQHRQRLLRENPAAIREIERDLSLFFEKTPLASARREHFRGRLASDPPQKGAKALYMECRIPDADIARFNVNTIRSVFGVPKELENQPEAIAQLVPIAQRRARLAKEYASYWLGILAYEEGRPDVAVDYFQKRTLEAYPDGVFTVGAKYNLARSLEALGRDSEDSSLTAEAISLYDEDASPQSHGNRLRAERLK